MSSYMSFWETPQPDGKLAGKFPLGRQTSIYSLTLDEFQTTLGGGKDFSSINMDDLLKSIWTAEERQTLQSFDAGGMNMRNLQRQGSLTLPQTVSQRTVNEVWRDVLKETVAVNSRGLNLGEMTLEEFLSKAGVVREDDIQPPSGISNSSYYGNTSGLTLGFQHPSHNHVLANQKVENIVSLIPRSQPQLHPLFPKQPTMNFSSTDQLSSAGGNGLISRITNGLNGSIVQGGSSVVSESSNAAVVKGGSHGNNKLYSDAVVKGCMDVLPSSYSFGERSNGSLEKVVERRQKRMMKNRESASRSRARKQAYTLELEAEVTKLREMNEELKKKQKEFMEMQKNEMLETMNKPWGEKRRCLRRTLTGPW